MDPKIKLNHLIWKQVLVFERGRDSSVGIATRYGLDGPGIESRWGARFSAPVQTGPGVPGLFPGGEAAGACRWPPTPIQRRG